MNSRYINPYTDFGFKKLFGEESNKDLLIDFLNQLLPAHTTIKELSFKNPEHMGENEPDRKAIFDLYCMSESGERFIVEMQKAKIQFFKDRALFYTTFPIREQAPKGEWNYRLQPIYFVALLDFFYDEDQERAKVKRDVVLKDQDCEVFTDKINYIFLQMPAFTKTEEELETHYDKWMYFLKHLDDFNEIPAILKEPIFERAFEVAEIANFNSLEKDAYHNSLKVYLDLVNVVQTSYDEGFEQGIEKGLEKGIEKGIEKGLEKVVINCLAQGMTLEAIQSITGLSIAQIQFIQQKLNN